MSKKGFLSKNLSGGKSKMADFSDDDERIVSPTRHFRFRGKDNVTGLTMSEILKRANLFKDEYNQEDIHDRILVLQVMPDDYEMRELTARLELDEGTALNEVKSKVREKSRAESANEMPTAMLSSDTHTEDTGEDFVISARVDDDDGQHYSSVGNDEVPSRARSPTPEISGTFETSHSSVRERFVSQSNTDEGKSDYGMESVSFWSESKTERSDVSQKNSVTEGDNSALERIETSRCSELKASDCSVKVDSEAMDEFETYSSMSKKPIPLPRSIFQDTSGRFSENERELNVYNCDTKSGSTNGESEFPQGEKTELGSAEYVSRFEPRNGMQESGSAIDESESSDSASTCDVLREHRIYVHACWLAVNSSYFRSMLFQSGMRECTSAEFCMKVTEFEEDAFLLLLRSIYDPDVLDTVEIGQLLNVLRLSVKYEVRFATVKARRVLEAVPLTLNVCEAILEAVNSGGLPDLAKVMKNVEVQLLGEFEPLDETWESEKFATLSEDALRFILSSDRLIVQSENTVFIALMQWIAKNAELSGEDISEYSDLISLVRFELLKSTYIHDVVRGNEIAVQLDNFGDVYLEAMTYHALPSKRRREGRLPRQWCVPKNPTFTWILYPEPEMFSFEEEDSNNSAQSSSFWFYGYKMHLQLNLSTSQDETCLFLVVENLVEDGSVEVVYDVDVKFGAGLHKSFTCDSFVYRGDGLATPPGNYPFDERYSIGEIKEILLGSFIKVPIMFEIILEKILND